MNGPLDICVADAARSTGFRTEDGELIVVLDFTVQATAPNGRRWEHKHRFAGAAVMADDEYPCFHRQHGDQKAAQRLSDRVAAHLSAGGRLNPAHWHEIEPQYGSEWYAQSGAEFDLIEWEREQEQMW